MDGRRPPLSHGGEKKEADDGVILGRVCVEVDINQDNPAVSYWF